MKKNGLSHNICRFFLSIQPFMKPLFSGQQEMSNLDYYSQDGGKTGAQTNQSFLKIKKKTF